MAIDRKSKTYKVVCVECKKERFVTYTQYMGIKIGASKGLCHKCANHKNATNLYRKGHASWNKGLHISGMSGRKHTIKQHEALLRRNQLNNPSHDPEVREKMRLAKLGKPNYTIHGKKHWNWKGASGLKRLILGSLKYKEWHRAIYKRDGYTCQECNQVGGKLNVHHIKAFALLMQDFLNVYNQFSPFEDQEILSRLSENYLPFWDINNGITLCRKCHHATPNYGTKQRVCNA